MEVGPQNDEYKTNHIPEINVINDWNYKIESISNNVKNQAVGYAWQYEKMVSKFSSDGKVMSIMAGIISLLTGVSGVIEIFDFEEIHWTTILITILGFTSATLNFLSSTCNFSVRQVLASNAQVGYSALQRTITYQLALPVASRIKAQVFVTDILKELNSLNLNSPVITRSIKAEYVKKFKNNPIYNPEGQAMPRTSQKLKFYPRHRHELTKFKKPRISATKEQHVSYTNPYTLDKNNSLYGFTVTNNNEADYVCHINENGELVCNDNIDDIEVQEVADDLSENSGDSLYSERTINNMLKYYENS